jgi:hypothetical protein
MDILLRGLTDISNEINTKSLVRDAANEKFYIAFEDKIAQIKHFLENPEDLNLNLKINPRYVMEYQIGGLSCGRRALNNLLEEHIFEKDIGYEIENLEIPLPKDANGKKINLFAFCNLLQKEIHTIDASFLDLGEDNGIYCKENEYYDVNVIQRILEYMGYANHDLVPALFVEESNIKGYIINIPGHWYSIVKKGSKYYELNSTGNKYYEEKTFEDVRNLFQGNLIRKVIKVENKNKFINPLKIIKDGSETKRIALIKEKKTQELKTQVILTINSNTNINQDNKDKLIKIMVSLDESKIPKFIELIPKIDPNKLAIINNLLSNWGEKIYNKFGLERELKMPDLEYRILLSMFLLTVLSETNAKNIINKMNDREYMKSVATKLFNTDSDRYVDKADLNELYQLLNTNRLTDSKLTGINTSDNFHTIISKL